MVRVAVVIQAKDRERFWSKVADEDPLTGCWKWEAFISPDGYGRVWWGNRNPNAHRISYELMVGPIPEGMTVDHLCHSRDPECRGGSSCAHRRCVNPTHLEVVPCVDNFLRSGQSHWTHCVNGHEFTEENTYWRPTGGRACKTCTKERMRIYRRKKSA